MNDLREQLREIFETAIEEIKNSMGKEEFEQIRIRFSGKKGRLTEVLKRLGTLSAEERPLVGQFANEIRDKIEEMIQIKKAELSKKDIEQKIASEKIDITMPAKKISIGKRHPLSQVTSELEDIFIGMGFTIAEGPDIEYAYYNFTALNTPEDHPARDLQDTFYTEENGVNANGNEVVLRTQTSSVQIRFMEKNAPPIRMICPGRVFRSDEVDATHSPMFHQLEGLVVDKNVTMKDLRETLQVFVSNLFSPDTKIRFRPHHFPFTEPSAEVDLSCFVCGGKGCPVCKNEGWIELLGAGMVHPNVLRNCGINPDEYSGFAFGFGIDRIVMAKYGISDMRLLFENDKKFLSQF